MAEDRAVELAELLAEVRRIDVLSKRLVTDMLAGSYSSVFRGAGLEFDRVREYVEGDDPRTVDWNVTARMGRPFVKTYVDERELTVLFLLDLSASMPSTTATRSASSASATESTSTCDPRRERATRCASCATASRCPRAA